MAFKSLEIGLKINMHITLACNDQQAAAVVRFSYNNFPGLHKNQLRDLTGGVQIAQKRATTRPPLTNQYLLRVN